MATITRVRSYRQRLRSQVLDAYGGTRCNCCGETTPEFLQVDHMFNDGAEHRKEVGLDLYAWLKRNHYPKGFQILCANCNHGKHKNGGICPHVNIPGFKPKVQFKEKWYYCIKCDDKVWIRDLYTYNNHKFILCKLCGDRHIGSIAQLDITQDPYSSWVLDTTGLPI